MPEDVDHPLFYNKTLDGLTPGDCESGCAPSTAPLSVGHRRPDAKAIRRVCIIMRVTQDPNPTFLPEQNETFRGSDRRLRVGIVGCRIGHRHALAFARLSALYEVRAVCDIDAGRARYVADALGGVDCMQSYDELLGRGGLDLISICTPPYLHFEQISEALQAGCHVICEKPLVGSLRELDELDLLGANNHARIIPVFQMRFGGGLQKLKRLVELGVAGRSYLATIETAWYRTREYYEVPWRRTWRGSLGGCLLGHAVHAHDMLTYINGPVARVRAIAKTLVNPVETEDCATASLEMNDGSLASLSVTLGSVVELSRLRFCYENLVAESNSTPYDCSSDPWKFVGASPEIEKRISEALLDWKSGPEGYDAQFLDAYRVIREGEQGVAQLSDARASIELVSALYHSAQYDETVCLPMRPDHPAYGGFHSAENRGIGGACSRSDGGHGS